MGSSSGDYATALLVVGFFWLHVVWGYGIGSKLSRAFMVLMIGLLVLALFAD